MEAIILSGGFGTRLRPLSFSCPKPLIPFCNIPILKHQINALSNVGVKKVILAVSEGAFTSEALDGLLNDLRAKYNLSFIASVEKSPLGTAGPLALAERFIEGQTFFTLNSDIACAYPLAALLSFHLRNDAEATILAVKTKEPWKYGVMETKAGYLVQRFIEKPKEFVSDLINGGVYCLDRKIFSRIEKRKMSIEREVFPHLAKENKLFYYNDPAKTRFWMDIGEPKNYLIGTKLYMENIGKTLLSKNGDSKLKKVKISNFVVLGANCLIEEGVSLDSCVLFDNVIIRKNCSIKNSIIGWNCLVESHSKIKNFSILEKDVVIERNSVLDNVIVCSHKTVNGEIYDKILL